MRKEKRIALLIKPIGRLASRPYSIIVFLRQGENTWIRPYGSGAFVHLDAEE